MTGCTPAETALLARVGYGAVGTPESLTRFACSTDYSCGVPVTAAELRTALGDCFAKGWLRVIDAAAREAIVERLRAGGVLGPIYGLPSVGCVDFTDEWASAAQERRAAGGARRGVPFAYSDMVHRRSFRYYPSRRAAEKDVAELREVRGITASDPEPIGPWRPAWWLRFDSGYRVAVEEFWEFRGCARGGDRFFWSPVSGKSADPARLGRVLREIPLTPVEWCVLCAMCEGQKLHSRYPVLNWAVARAAVFAGVTLTEDDVRAALESCVRQGRAAEGPALRTQIESLLQADPVFCPIPPLRKRSGRGASLTPAGAAVFLTALRGYFGPAWADDLRVERETYREEHRYCPELEGIRAILPEYPGDGHVLLSSRVERLGPWCVYWWKVFPAGYRLEIELARPEPESRQ